MANNTITLKGDPVRGEALASGSVTPGFLLEMTSATADTVVAHNSAGQNAEKMFALEDELQGNKITTAYATTKLVQYGIFKSGDEVYALLANGQSATKGGFLESDGAGSLNTHSADSAGIVEYPLAIVAVALETVDLSDSSGADPSTYRIKVRIV